MPVAPLRVAVKATLLYTAPRHGRSVISIAHLIFIPLVLLVGGYIGWSLGTRAAEAEIARLRAELELRERERAAQRLAQVKGEAAPSA